jgi:osmotically-inducible protein OsmY
VKEKKHGRSDIVPSQWIQELHEDRILLSHWEPESPGVPTHAARRGDAASAEDIAADLAARIQAYPKLRRVQVKVVNGLARLFGTVEKDEDKARAETIARGALGIVDVTNQLKTDPELQGLVKRRVAAFMGVKSPPFKITVDHGMVILKGAVQAKEDRVLIDALVRAIPGVAGVMNELEIDQKTAGNK